MTAASILMVGDAAPAADTDYRLSPDAALLVSSNGNGFVLDMAARFYAIPAVGAAMLRRTLEAGEDAALAEIVARYDVDEATGRADLRRFLEDLRARGSLRRRGDVESSVEIPRGAAMIARAARLALRLPGDSMQASALLALSRLSFARYGWTATLAAWRACVPQNDRPAGNATGQMASVDRAVRSLCARMPIGCACKERALSAWAMARSRGVACALVVGVVQYPLGAHTWCEADGPVILGDEPANCARYLPVFRYA